MALRKRSRLRKPQAFRLMVSADTPIEIFIGAGVDVPVSDAKLFTPAGTILTTGDLYQLNALQSSDFSGQFALKIYGDGVVASEALPTDPSQIDLGSATSARFGYRALLADGGATQAFFEGPVSSIAPEPASALLLGLGLAALAAPRRGVAYGGRR